jgi:protein-S-isoprenylcysteine O-methyltransferase Ste14
MTVSVIFFAIGDILSWRMDAGLNQDHELVQAGPYRLIRHPIYCSMLCMLMATGALFTPGIALAISVVIFLTGTEIRVRIEDSLLAARFGDEFRAYQRSVRAYIPGLR